MTKTNKEAMLFNLKQMEVMHWDKQKSPFKDEVYLSVEEPLAVEINGQKKAILMRLPGSEKELAVGFCISEGLIQRFADILLVHHCGSFKEQHLLASTDALETRNIVRIKTAAAENVRGVDLEMLLIRSGCGRNSIADTGVQLPYCNSKLSITAESLAKMSIQLCNQQKVKRLSGGLHSAALFDNNGQVLASYEDVGRHNAMDKVIGHALLHDIDLKDKIVFTTGRTSYEMVTKAARVGLPILLSLSSPTSLSVEYAQNCGITLVGYVRQSKMVVYTCPERIEFETALQVIDEKREEIG